MNRPALFLGRREIAHYDGEGNVDLRITASGWRRVDFADDPAVTHDKSRRDWVSICVSSVEDVERLRPLLVATVRANEA